MGSFRFRRSVKIAPGVRLNFSKSGVSTSIGTRGAHVTLGHGKVRKTVGIPGTGVSYTEIENTRPQEHLAREPDITDSDSGKVLGNIGAALIIGIMLLAVAYQLLG